MGSSYGVGRKERRISRLCDACLHACTVLDERKRSSRGSRPVCGTKFVREGHVIATDVCTEEQRKKQIVDEQRKG